MGYGIKHNKIPERYGDIGSEKEYSKQDEKQIFKPQRDCLKDKAEDHKIDKQCS
ncbi:MAG: hypothetical protein ACD_2C00098G0001 [uncultured bacterium (gcode 4)]|uniref:Uncharacterized protein n=1 Tax=uncultured bacterium (gcode 4) TaxID=1234023 RepID=K2G653_9BACT|nr:MAG: hypothetical protein ACD_2C00098G0001 [uncultured bacterium (gcode 4)]